jgi:hypothetical protein
MPKRTNALQKAIKLIESYKGDFLTLQESAMLLDKFTGNEREVDILLEGKINSHSIKVAIEVRDRKRPADTTWVEEMLFKHNSLPTDKLILVSSSGFTKGAQEKAQLFDAITIDTSEGDKEFRKLLERAAFIKGVRIKALIFVDDTPINFKTKLQIGNYSGTAEEQILVLCNNEKFKEIILNTGNTNEPGIVAEVPIPFSVDDIAANENQKLKFIIFTDPIPDVPANFSTIQYQGVDYVYGKVGNNPIYFVFDMAGELIGHEGNA